MKVLIIPDKFKGTLTAFQAADAIAAGWRQTRPNDDLEVLPMSDGGDGFGEVMSRLLGAAPQAAQSLDAAHKPCHASWWWDSKTKTAIVESASVIGLAQLSREKYHPFELDTEGLGILLRAASNQGAKHCLVGIGGSATNDGGFGLARALGWQFFNAHDEKIDRWTELHDLAEIRPPEQIRCFEELIVAVDVQNPLLGPTGCTRIYGPQKGLLPSDFDFAERCLQRLADVLRRELHRDCADEPGSGAAGGLGFGLRCFAEGRLEPGFELFAQHAKIAERIASVAVVITGEGSLDGSSLMGKGVGQLATLCREHQIPCIGLAGIVPHSEQARAIFTQAHALAPTLTSVEEAMADPARWLEKLAAKVSANLNPAGRVSPSSPAGH
jgi:glycerate kinase